MIFYSTFLVIFALSVAAFFLVKNRITKFISSGKSLNSLPRYYAISAILWVAIPALLVTFSTYLIKGASASHLPITLVVSLLGFTYILLKIKPEFSARKHLEKWIKFLLIACTILAVSITAMIVASILFESIRFFEKVPVHDFLLGLKWSPQTALRADQAGSSGSFGMIPVFVGTLLITGIAMIVAVPLGLLSAIYLSEYASKKARNTIKPILEILAGIPTVVYGFFAAIVFAPFLRDFGILVGLDIASEAALVAGLVMGIMIIPMVLSLSDDVIKAVPKDLRMASLGMGATESETVRKVVLPAALPGITGAVLLALSRGIGETMIVTMAAGLAANLTINPLESVTTVTAQIVTLLVGDQEFDSAKTLAAFALSLVLFLVTLALNMIAMVIVKRYREAYE